MSVAPLLNVKVVFLKEVNESFIPHNLFMHPKQTSNSLKG